MSAVETRSSSSSCRYYGDLVVDAAKSSGFLANIVTEEQSFGSSRCPWIVAAPRGQRLNISLVDFGLARRHESIASSPGLGSGATGPVDGLVNHAAGGVCHVYAKISERGASTSDITVWPHFSSVFLLNSWWFCDMYNILGEFGDTGLFVTFVYGSYCFMFYAFHIILDEFGFFVKFYIGTFNLGKNYIITCLLSYIAYLVTYIYFLCIAVIVILFDLLVFNVYFKT